MKKKIPETKKNSKPIFNKTGFIIFILALISGIALGYLTTYLIISKSKVQNFSESRAGGYKFINPLLECDNFHPSYVRDLASLTKELNDYVKKVTTDGKIKHISVYYRDLNNGPWIGINEQFSYSPTNLLKVPLLIAILKKAESDTGILNTLLPYNSPIDTAFNQNTEPFEQLEVGKSYTIEQLLEHMIIYSENDAKELLVNFIGLDYLASTTLNMGIDLSSENFADDFLTIKEYSSFFRILYNASYLNRDMSEKALQLLSKVKFNDGIPAKLPKEIIVSHKFEERGYSGTQVKELQDCGIVYLEGKPYLLCIMTKGEGFENLSSVIANISEIVYRNVK